MTTLVGSASSLGRTLNCPASQHLPHTAPRSEKMEAAARRGTAIHKYLQLAPEGIDRALEAVPEEYREECKEIPLEVCAGKYTPPHLREVSMVYNAETRTVRETEPPTEEDHSYGELDSFDIPGTADVVVAGYSTLEIWDYKTGKVPQGEPGEAPQLLHGALCAQRLYAPRANYIVVGYQTIRHLKRPKKVQVKTQRALIDKWDLDAYEERVVQATAEAKEVKAAIDAGEEPRVKTGDWCRFCPAKPSCPVLGR